MELPEDIVNHICCLAIRLNDPHPFAEEIKTLVNIYDIINIYESFYNSDEALDWLSIDLEEQFFNEQSVIEGWGVHRKWKSLTPSQRRSFSINLK